MPFVFDGFFDPATVAQAQDALGLESLANVEAAFGMQCCKSGAGARAAGRTIELVSLQRDEVAGMGAIKIAVEEDRTCRFRQNGICGLFDR